VKPVIYFVKMVVMTKLLRCIATLGIGTKRKKLLRKYRTFLTLTLNT